MSQPFPISHLELSCLLAVLQYPKQRLNDVMWCALHAYGITPLCCHPQSYCLVTCTIFPSVKLKIGDKLMYTLTK